MHGKEKTLNKATVSRIVDLIRPYRVTFILAQVMVVISVALTLYAPVIIGRAIDMIISAGRVEFAALAPQLIKLGTVAAATALAQWLMNVCNNKIAYGAVKDVREQAFAKLQELPLSYIDSKSYGDIISRITTDADQLSDGLIMGFSQLFTGVATILGTLIFMFSVNIIISAAVVVITPLSFFVARFISSHTYVMFRQQAEIRSEITVLTEEIIGNQKPVRAFGYEKEAQSRFDKINKNLQKVGLRAVFFSSLTNPSTRFVNNLVYAAVGTVGAFAVMGRFGAGLALTVGQLSCLLTYANQYTKPFNEISGVVTELQNAFASARHLFDLIDEPPQTPDSRDARVLTDADGRVEIDNVSFSYVPDVPLIENFNLSVQPGQRIAIVGPTGCGKTTFINLLMRFYDVTGGEIRVSGMPVEKITRDSLRGSFGMVLQDTWLKSATIRDNIAYGKPNATDEEVVAAAKAAHAHSFIKRLPEGYDTVISEDGENISQGQKQLLCIARVMLCLPPMLILDEATSSIDTRTEIRIQRAFEKMMEGRTSFIVAHRLSTIRNADLILVMRDGHIIEQGTHEELLEKNGIYAELCSSSHGI
ncbi:MAG: ABC transporter ATP-binding protein [Monoglobaceae bacterium]